MKNTKSTIPLKLRQQLSEDPTYSYCCLTGVQSSPADPVEWHHNLKFAGKNAQARFCILPILRSIHLKADIREVREKLNWVMWSRATAEEIAEFSKSTNYAHEFIRLKNIYGEYVEPTPTPAKAKTEEEKPLWYPIKGDYKEKIATVIKFHAKREGIRYNNASLLDHLIDERYEEVTRLEAEYADTPAPGTVF